MAVHEKKIEHTLMVDDVSSKFHDSDKVEDGVLPGAIELCSPAGSARWYRSTLFNVVLIGLISLTQPGIWAALNNVGAGGQQEPYLVNGANALIFGLMAFGCPIFGVLSNKFGLKKMLIIGTLGFAPYSASLYVNNRYGVQWFVLVGALTCGISAAALWTCEAAVAVGYAAVNRRGIYTGIWLGLRELGQIIGASIQLSLNFHQNERGKVGYATYLVLIGLQCLGLPLALIVSPPHKAIRSDGTRVTTAAKERVSGAKVRELWSVLRQKHMLLLVPVCLFFQFNNTYQSIYLTLYFSVRARTLAALTSGLAVTIADFFWGWFLDLKAFSRPTKAKFAIVFFSISMLSLFGWQISNERLYSSMHPDRVTIDWTSHGFGRALAVNVLFRFMNESHVVLVFWLVGAFHADMQTVTLGVGLINGFEALGSTIANGLGAARISPMVNLAVAAAVFVCSIPTTLLVAWTVPEYPSDTN